MITPRIILIVGIIAVLTTPGISIAQDSKNQGYLIDTYGNDIVNSPASGLCWRTSDWTPARAAAYCDPVASKAEAPAPRVAVAAAPAPKPAVAPASAPTKVAPQSINFSGDALFAFDKSELKPEGRVLLEDFARQLSGAQFDAIVVTGHTDRLGSNEYNQKLSERRANAVKDYLASRNIPANRINASGKSDTQPVTALSDCKGAQSAKVIACLQPDRRVQGEVTGTKGPTASSR